MNLPGSDDFIDIHNHGASPIEGVFQVETLMAHEGRKPANLPGMAFTCGIHPWNLDETNHGKLIATVIQLTADPMVVAVGEAGFDKIKGPSPELQRKAFEEQIIISEEIKKPVVIHCVRAWEELLRAHKKMKPRLPWMVHGFRGKYDLAMQLISKNMFISFWYDFIIRAESGALVKQLPSDRIFLETDGSGANIRDIYNKVSSDLDIAITELKKIILSNYYNFFNVKP